MKIELLGEIEGDVKAIDTATSFAVAKCSEPSCPHVHLLPCGPDGRPYTMVVMSLQQVRNLAALAEQIWKEKAQ